MFITLTYVGENAVAVKRRSMTISHRGGAARVSHMHVVLRVSRAKCGWA
jgi:hypothetical protein